MTSIKINNSGAQNCYLRKLPDDLAGVVCGVAVMLVAVMFVGGDTLLLNGGSSVIFVLHRLRGGVSIMQKISK